MKSVRKSIFEQDRETALGRATDAKWKAFEAQRLSKFSDLEIDQSEIADRNWNFIVHHCRLTGENPTVTEGEYPAYAAYVTSLYS